MTTTTREHLAGIAAEYGWTVTDRGGFVRGTEYVGVSYSTAGQVRSAQWNIGNGHASGALHGFVGIGAPTKVSTVAAWLAR